jgi:2,4-dienoyl-CoA reductase-like NADH-dependent reductase (Old Yellow Enzyme family)
LLLGEMRDVVQQLLHDGRLDYVDLSLWDVFKEPIEEEFRSQPLVDWFTSLDRRNVRVGVAGKIMDGATARRCLQHGADFVTIGRAAILHHDFPRRVSTDQDFASLPLPVSADHLRAEGLGPAFVGYMRTWKGFVAE